MDQAAEASPAPGMPDAMFGYAEAARAMLWSVESTRAMLELNRTPLDLGRDVLRRQQDAVILAMQQALRGPSAPDHAPAEGGFADLARLSLEAFDRMATAMRAVNDAARWTQAGKPENVRKAEPR